MTAMLDSLPTELLRHCLLPLLKMRCLVQLDSAVCCKQSREEYHELLVGLQIHTGLCAVLCRKSVMNALRWLNERNILAKDFTARDDINIGDTSCLKKIHELHIQTYGRSNLCSTLASRLAADTLERLIVTGSSGNTRLSDVSFHGLFRRQQNLQVVELVNIADITDKIILQISANCTGLRTLSVVNCQGVRLDDTTMQQLGADCTNLKSLTVGQLSFYALIDDALDHLAVHCRSLEELHVLEYGSWSKYVWDWPLLEKCTHLRKISFVGFSISPDRFFTIAQLCKNLQCLYVDLNDCNPQVDMGFEQLSHTLTELAISVDSCAVESVAPSWYNLRVLELSLDSFDCDAALQRVAEFCTSLTSLTLLMCVSNCGLLTVAAHMPQLQVLVLRDATNTGDEGVCAIAHHCTNLHSIKIGESDLLTDIGVQALLNQNNITNISVIGCFRVSRTMIKRCSEMNYLNYGSEYRAHLDSMHRKYGTAQILVGLVNNKTFSGRKHIQFTRWFVGNMGILKRFMLKANLSLCSSLSTKMSELLCLPVDFIQHHLLSQLPVQWLVRLDSALCCKQTRSEFHHCLSGHAIEVPKPIRQTLTMLPWLKERNMYMKNFEFYDSSNLSELNKRNLLTCIERIQELQIHTKGHPTVFRSVTDRIQHHHLLVLSVSGTNAYLTDRFFESFCRHQRNLQSVLFCGCNSLTDHTLTYLAKYCPELRKFMHFCCRGFAYSESVLNELRAGCVHLKRVSLFPAAHITL